MIRGQYKLPVQFLNGKERRGIAEIIDPMRRHRRLRTNHERGAATARPTTSRRRNARDFDRATRFAVIVGRRVVDAILHIGALLSLNHESSAGGCVLAQDLAVGLSDQGAEDFIIIAAKLDDETLEFLIVAARHNGFGQYFRGQGFRPRRQLQRNRFAGGKEFLLDRL